MELGEDTAGAKRAAEDAGDGGPDAKVARVDGEPAGAATRGLPRDAGPAPRRGACPASDVRRARRAGPRRPHARAA